jgi:EAL domain-containing protein (putative c-di-GMP-specific phosphodiesterase class I)
VDPAGLVVELTETTVMGDRSRVAPQIHALAEAGVRIAIDDLGAGASSLARLKELPVQLLKLDRSFLRDVPDSAQARALVRALVDLSAALETVLVVEGVETDDQRRFLAEAGCPLAQGYLLGRPAPAAALGGLLRAAASAVR